MIIPVRCFTCGAVIADKWTTYINLVDKYRKATKQDDIELLDIDSLVSTKEEPTAEFLALKDIEIKRVCCRRHFLCNVDMVDII